MSSTNKTYTLAQLDNLYGLTNFWGLVSFPVVMLNRDGEIIYHNNFFEDVIDNRELLEEGKVFYQLFEDIDKGILMDLFDPDEFDQSWVTSWKNVKGELKKIKWTIEKAFSSPNEHNVVLLSGKEFADEEFDHKELLGSRNDFEQIYTDLHLVDKINRASIEDVPFKDVAELMLGVFFDLCRFDGSRFYLYEEEEGGSRLKLVLHKMLSQHEKLVESKIQLKIKKVIPSLRQGSSFWEAVESGESQFFEKKEEVIRVVKDHSENKVLRTFAGWSVKMLKIKTFAIIPLKNKNKVFGIITFSFDRKLTEQEKERMILFANSVTAALSRSALQSENRGWLNIFNNSHNGIVAINQDQTIIEWNGGASRLFGYSKKHAIGRNMSFLFPKDLIDTVRESIKNALYGYKDTIESIVISESGTPIDVNISIFPLTDGNDQVIGVSAIIQDIRELKKLRNENMKAVLEGEEKERKRIAQDLHDGLGQMLSGLRINLSTIKEKIDEETYQRLLDITDSSIKEYRAISHNLVSPVIKHGGLVKALQIMAENLSKSGKPKIILKINTHGLDLEERTQLELYRIAQELTNNALKANAKMIKISLFRDEQRLSMSVKDDGDGFNMEEVTSDGIGLDNIQARVNIFNGKMVIRSTPGRGTHIAILLLI